MDSRTEKRRTGDIGEDLAAKFLVKHGYRVTGRNYLKKFGELDIICEKDGKIHFVEVKTVSPRKRACPFQQNVSRVTFDEYRPEDNLHPWKLKRIKRAIQVYLEEKKVSQDMEFHAILVILDREKKTAKIKMLKNLII
ncbi:MAG: YraN family protein [Candidatus Uhrbacteria bacterium]|nr:YraN family protein [Candidatus Uhrbacteria bacterium]